MSSAEGREVTVDLDALGVPTHDLNALDAPFSDEVFETIKTPSHLTNPLMDSLAGSISLLAHHQDRPFGSFILCLGPKV